MNALYCARVYQSIRAFVCVCVCAFIPPNILGFVRLSVASHGSLSRRVLECKLVTTFSCVINYASVLLGWMLSTKRLRRQMNKCWQKNCNSFSFGKWFSKSIQPRAIRLSIQNNVHICMIGDQITAIASLFRATLVCAGLPLIWTAFSIVYSRIISAFLLYKYTIRGYIGYCRYTARCHHRRLHKYYSMNRVKLI